MMSIQGNTARASRRLEQRPYRGTCPVLWRDNTEVWALLHDVRWPCFRSKRIAVSSERGLVWGGVQALMCCSLVRGTRRGTSVSVSLSPTLQAEVSFGRRQTDQRSISLAPSSPYTSTQPLLHYSQGGQSPDLPGPDLLPPSSCTARSCCTRRPRSSQLILPRLARAS